MVVSWIIEKAIYLYEGYLWTLTFADKRVENWPLMSSPKYTAALTILYLALCLYGHKLMKYCPAFELRSILVAYNSAMVALNAYICIETLIVALKANYNFSCEAVDYSNDPLSVRMAAVLWWFYISKLLEFFDTVFFVLRKKFNQLSFLHVYHHSTMFCFWWIGVKWVAGGSSFIGALLNSFVHVLMYAYYALAAAFPKGDFWWKRYLTVIQMIQFNVAIVQTIRGLRINCPFPRWMGYTLIGYMVSFIVLFGNFWFRSYTKGGRRDKTKKEVGDGKSSFYDAISPQKKHVAFANHSVEKNGESGVEKRKQSQKKPLRDGVNGVVHENGRLTTSGKEDLRQRIK